MYMYLLCTYTVVGTCINLNLLIGIVSENVEGTAEMLKSKDATYDVVGAIVSDSRIPHKAGARDPEWGEFLESDRPEPKSSDSEKRGETRDEKKREERRGKKRKGKEWAEYVKRATRAREKSGGVPSCRHTVRFFRFQGTYIVAVLHITSVSIMLVDGRQKE